MKPQAPVEEKNMTCARRLPAFRVFLNWSSRAGMLATAGTLLTTLVDKQIDDIRRIGAAEIEMAENRRALSTGAYTFKGCRDKGGAEIEITLVYLTNTAISSVVASGAASSKEIKKYTIASNAIVMRNKLVDQLLDIARGSEYRQGGGVCGYLRELAEAEKRCVNAIF